MRIMRKRRTPDWNKNKSKTRIHKIHKIKKVSQKKSPEFPSI